MKDMIVVGGMPRSGTSILTALLGTHPDVLLFSSINDGFPNFTECRLVDGRDNCEYLESRIECARERTGGKRILAKKCEVISEGRSFWEMYEPVKVVVPVKRFPDQLESWKRHGNNDIRGARQRYDCLYADIATMSLRTSVEVRVIEWKDIASKDAVAGLGHHLDLDPSGFGMSILDHNIREISSGWYGRQYGVVKI